MPSSSLVRSKVISSSEVSLPAANDTDDGMVNSPDSSLARTATVSASSLAMRFTGMAMEETSSLMLCWVVTFSGK